MEVSMIGAILGVLWGLYIKRVVIIRNVKYD